MKICLLYETACGGETVATEAIASELAQINDHIDSKYVAAPLSHTDFRSFFFWILKSVIYWLRIVLINRATDWICTTTYTGGVAAVLFKPFFRYKICWHFHGTRVPPDPKGLQGKTYVTQFLKYYTVKILHIFFLKFSDLILVPSYKSLNL